MIGGVMGTGYLGFLLLGKLDDYENRKELMNN